MTTAFGRLAGWLHRQMPTHQQIEANRFTAPLARRGELFRFTRRSVPRGIAAGLFVGIFALIPGVQIIGAALACVPLRGNIPLAAGMTFISNPLTTLLVILPLAVGTGNMFGYHADLETVTIMVRHGASLTQWADWIVSDTAPAIVLGLFIEAVIASALGYALAIWIWRLRVAARHRRRPARQNRTAVTADAQSADGDDPQP